MPADKDTLNQLQGALPDIFNTPEMKALKERQAKEQADLADFLAQPVPQFVVQGTSAGWGVWDRYSRRYVEGFSDSKREMENAAYLLNND